MHPVFYTVSLIPTRLASIKTQLGEEREKENCILLSDLSFFINIFLPSLCQYNAHEPIFYHLT